MVLSHLSIFVGWYNICMFQFITELTYANTIFEVLTNKTTKRFANFIFICSLKIKIGLSPVCLILTILGEILKHFNSSLLWVKLIARCVFFLLIVAHFMSLYLIQHILIHNKSLQLPQDCCGSLHLIVAHCDSFWFIVIHYDSFLLILTHCA